MTYTTQIYPARLPRAGRRLALFVLLGVACWCQAAQARVSLDSIDAKLDALLAAQTIDLDKRVELRAGTSNTTVCSRDRAYFRIYPDGTADSTEFVVPANHTLVILEVSWRAYDDPNSSFLSNSAVRLTLSSSNGFQLNTFYYSPIFPIGTSDTSTRPGTNETLTMGAAVGEGLIICGSVSSTQQSVFFLHTIETSTLRGILVPNN